MSSDNDSSDDDYVPPVEKEEKRAPKGEEVRAVKTDVDDLWKKMNQETKKDVINDTKDTKTDEQDTTKKEVKDESKVTIERSYEFAGKQYTERKQVDKNSAQARTHMKRKSLFGASDKPKKLNTLEKSRLEWSEFVDNEGIDDDLKRANKDGYLEKQDFLSRVRNRAPPPS